MTANKILIYLLITLLTINPASADDITLNRWVLNVTIQDDGLVEEVIQAEIMNPGPSPINGFSFVFPVTDVAINSNVSTGVTVSDAGEMSFNLPEVKQQAVSGKTNIIVSFNKPVEAGKKWSGRIGFTSENWATKDNGNYSINIPLELPQVIVSGKEVKLVIFADPDVRGQVFLPKAVELESVEPQPFRKLFQYGRVVPTWTPETLHMGDTIKIRASFSDVLNKIVEVDERSRELSNRIKEAKKQGKDVTEAEQHLSTANDYNNNQALASFGEKKYSIASEYAGYANDELAKAEESLSGRVESKEPEPIETQKAPGFEISGMIFAILIISLFRNAIFK